MTILHQIEGDVFHVGPRLPSNWFHGAVLDPIYGWNFMGRQWDAAHRAHAVDLLDVQARSIGWATAEQRKALNLKPWNDAELYCLWSLQWLRQIYRVLVPGSYAVIFHGSKSYHRIAFPAELAGFEVQPMLAGLVGSAMATGADVSKAIDRDAGAEREKIGEYESPDGTTGWNGQDSAKLYGAPNTTSGERRSITAPATPLAQSFNGHRTRYRDMLLPICVLLKPPEGSYAVNARKWGVGGFAIDACRVPVEPEDAEAVAAKWTDTTWKRSEATTCKAAYNHRNEHPGRRPDISAGRVPGNVLLVDEAAEAEVGRQSGESASGGSRGQELRGHRSKSIGPTHNHGFRALGPSHSDTGTAARFFPRFRYTARAAEQERLRGCEGFLWVADSTDPHGWRRVDSTEWLETDPRRRLQGTNHTTLKPVPLTEWLARLILPPPGVAAEIREETTGSRGRLLIPFAGVLSEAIGAGLAGWPEIVAIEREGPFVEQGAARWSAWGPFSEARAEALAKVGGIQKEPPNFAQLHMFDSTK